VIDEIGHEREALAARHCREGGLQAGGPRPMATRLANLIT